MIDPAEALLAVIGVRPIISHAIERIAPKDLARAVALPDELKSEALKMCRGEQPDLTWNDFDRVDYASTLRDLSTPYLPQQVEQMIASIPPGSIEGIQAAFISLSDKTFNYLYSQLPIVLRKSAAGDNNVMPPQRLVSRFEALLWALDNPIGVFGLMQNATLTHQQLDGLHAIYPTLVAHISDVSLPDAVEDMRIERPRFQFKRQTEQGVRRFLGRLPMAPELSKVLQAVPDTKPQQQKPSGEASGVLSTETAPETAQIKEGISP